MKDISINNVKETLMEFSEDDRKYINLLFRPIYETDCFKEKNSIGLTDLHEYFDLGKSLGYNIVRNNYYYKTCEACGDDNFFYLMPDLSMWKCINDLKYNNAKIGYIDQNGTVNINADNLIYWRKATDCFKDNECLNCKLLPDCYGGCILYKSKNNQRLCKEFTMASLPYLY